MFAADAVSSMGICLVEDELCSEELLICSAAPDMGSTLVHLVVSSK